MPTKSQVPTIAWFSCTTRLQVFGVCQQQVQVSLVANFRLWSFWQPHVLFAIIKGIVQTAHHKQLGRKLDRSCDFSAAEAPQQGKAVGQTFMRRVRSSRSWLRVQSWSSRCSSRACSSWHSSCTCLYSDSITAQFCSHAISLMLYSCTTRFFCLCSQVRHSPAVNRPSARLEYSEAGISFHTNRSDLAKCRKRVQSL